jgi:O-antigen/teichoic acid export membrane protein
MFGGYGLRIAIQAIYFVLIARALGVEQYGAFVAVTALVSIMAPFAGFGAPNLLVKNVARDRSLFAVYWGNGLLMSAASGIGFLAIVAVVARFALPGSVAMHSVLLVAISDLLLVKVVELASMAFMAVESMSNAAQLQVFISASRLAGIVVLRFITPHPTAAAWAVVYLAASLGTALFALGSTVRKLGAPRLALRRIGPEFTEGIYFSVSLSAQTIYNDIDKTMLARMVALDAAGIYAAAYRIIDVAFTPVRSILYAAYPRFFRHGSEGIAAARAFGVRLTRPAAIYCLCAAAAMLAGASLLPLILGAQFSRTAEALRWLALLPLLKTLHYFMADALSGAGFQGIRTLMQMIVAVFNVLLNLWIIPAYSWRGAAWSSLASDGLLAALLYAALCFKCRDANDRGAATSPSISAVDRTMES